MSVEEDRLQQLQAEFLKHSAELRVVYTEIKENEKRAEAVEAQKVQLFDARVLEARLLAKDAELMAVKRVQEAEVSKERAEKESAQKEVLSVRASAAKDIHIAKLEMQLELARFRAEERAPSEAGPRVKARRLGQAKLNDANTFFPRLVSSTWGNEVVGVNSFSRLAASVGGESAPPSDPAPMPRLVYGVANAVGEETDDDEAPDARYRAFGFCYKGPALTPGAFAKTPHLKEAYGVTVGDVHYVCIVCFNQNSRKLPLVAALPYAGGPLPHSITPDLVPGCGHHISVYKPFVHTDDPVLEMLKRPSADKWFWHSPAE
jgi:hypothetical protein